MEKVFSFAGMVANDDGKTSATKIGGLFIIFIGGLCFAAGCVALFIGKDTNIVTESTVFTSVGASLLGIKNWVKSKNIEYNGKENENPTKAINS